jgi:replication-associated recombination protein RarA
MSLADIRSKGKQKPPRIILYGGAGIGKTTFASKMPNPIFILTEDGMGTIEAPQTPLCTTFD